MSFPILFRFSFDVEQGSVFESSSEESDKLDEGCVLSEKAEEEFGTFVESSVLCGGLLRVPPFSLESGGDISVSRDFNTL